MSGVEVGIVVTSGLVLAIFLGVRIVYATAAAGIIGLIAMVGVGPALGIAGTIPHSKTVSFPLTVIPLYLLIGYLAFHAGITQAAFRAARAWLGWLPGGLAVASVLGSAGFAAVSGASTATAAVFARVAVPEMLKANYSKPLAGGVVAAGGTLASLIPPSGILVIYAIIVEQSVGKLLLAGFLPGLLSAFIYVAIIVVMCWMRPELAERVPDLGWTEKLKSLPGTTPIVATVVIILSAVFYGWATPTEAAALGLSVIFVIALWRGMRWAELRTTLLETAKLTALIFAVIWGVLLFVRFLGFAQLPEAFANFISGLEVDRFWVLMAILLSYVILGMFMDAIGMLILTLPVVFPVIVALGYDPIWFGIIVVKMAEVCLITPPIGLNCFVVNGVRPDLRLSEIFKGVGPFFLADVATIALLIAFPEIVTFLPELAFER
jgi:tripartite ATP-independent transporter DctM subunit